MIFKTFFDEPTSTFTYLLASQRGSEAIIIDPVLDHVNDYLKCLGENNLRLIIAFDTHTHADHITGLGKLRKLTMCRTAIGEESSADVVSQRVKDGDILTIHNLEFKVLHTPGHTDDSYCLYRQGMLFSGDTLFIRGNGRTDFQNGDPEMLYNSLKDKIFTLPDETTVYPGHDYKGELISTIGAEKVQNPRFANKSKEEFIDIMKNLNLPDPKFMDIAVPLNQSIGQDINDGIPAEFLIDTQKGMDLLANQKDCLFVDIREFDELKKTGKISGALHVPYGDFDKVLNDNNQPLMKHIESKKPLVIYCAHGERSALALIKLQSKNIVGPFNMLLGITAWIKQNGATESV
jgi:sulfur dioxygenase